MAFNNQIPQPEDLLSKNQPEFRDNFMELQALLDVNHYTFGDPNEGKHRFLEFPTPSGPVRPPRADEDTMSAFVPATTNLPEIGYLKPNLLFNFITTKQFPQQRFPSWATVGGNGLLMKWGQCTTIGFSRFAFPDDGGVAIPRFANPPYTIMLSPVAEGNNNDIWIRLSGNPTRFVFDVYGGSRTQVGAAQPVTFYYLAIGN